MSNYDSIIFDLDGTLFQTDKLVITSFKNTFRELQRDGYKFETLPSEKEILAVIGLTLDNIWGKLLTELPKEAYIKASNYLLRYELEGIRAGYGSLYPGVVDTLIELNNSGLKLFIASNGIREYIYEVTKAFKIDNLFTAQYCANDFNTNSKSELVKKIISFHNIKKGIMVGDRLSDVEAGINNNLYVIGCNFGFSFEDELAKSNIIVDEFYQIYDILNNKIKKVELN
ncbi:MAG: HAD family hydrolase [Vulcanibacillus sp.]